MNFQWLTMRIQEEKDRRLKVERTLARLPDALDEVFRELDDCMKLYTEAFGTEAARLELLESKLRISIREQKDGQWQECGAVDVSAVPALPGFRIERAGQEPVDIVFGLLPDDKLYYRDEDHYITMEDLTRRILDRTLFPKLKD
jgi:hypothetical protein